MSIKKIRQEIDEVEDINMTPIMSLFVILIPFLLLAAVFVKVSVISSPFPALGAGGETSGKENFVLNLKVNNDGFEVVSTANKSRKKDTVKIPKVNGNYQYEKLHKMMISIKKVFPNEYRLNLFPDSKVSYDTLVKVMDATRKMSKDDPEIFINDVEGKKVKQEYLFPDVVWMGVLT